MEKLASNKFKIIILAAIIIIAVSILMLLGAKKDNKDIDPSTANKEELSVEDIDRIKSKYEKAGNMEEFETLYNTIEQAVASKFLDGTITTDEELKVEIDKINKMFKTSNWEYLDLEYSSYWIGDWSLDAKGKLYFTFGDSKLKPDWVDILEIKDYIK